MYWCAVSPVVKPQLPVDSQTRLAATPGAGGTTFVLKRME